MNTPKNLNPPFTVHRKFDPAILSIKGSVLVYLIVVILIFGVLGVTIVSLFTTATTSSATPNDLRRADYMFESGMRYAFSELRNNNFDEDTINDLNTLTYTLTDAGSFDFNIFSLWFESAVDHPLPGGGTPLALAVPFGNIPDGYTIQPNLFVVNFESVDPLYPGGASAVITGISSQTLTTLDLNLNGGDDFIANAKERICLAVIPTADQNGINQDGEILVSLEAQNIFPGQNGAITITNAVDNIPYDYFYAQRIDEPGYNRVRLTNITRPPASGGFPLNVNITSPTYIILSPTNYFVIPEGQSGGVTHGGDLDFALNIYDLAPSSPGSADPDIDEEDFTDNINEVETDENLIVPDTDADTLNVGGGYTPPSGVDFGGGWYSGDLSIGGNNNFCNTGACLFGLGVRVFFTLDYTGNADGFTFTIMNADATNGNDITSIGGDPQLSELLAYAGDSRLVVNPTTSADFLDGSGEGIVPPKLAVEFDAKTNFDQNFEDEQNKDYCSGPNIKPNTRNDPEPGGAANRDAVQLVYWGDRAPITIDCRPNGNPSSYDDNRHNVKAGEGEQQWPFTTPTGVIVSKPAVDPDDGTIYVGSFDGQLYAINPDGTEKWRFPSFGSIGAVESSPTIGADGTVYVGSNDGHLYAINPDGTEKWQYPSAGSVGMIRSSPAIDRTGGLHDGTIYVGSGPNDSMSNGRLFAINPDGSLSWQFTPINSPDNDVDSSPAIDSAGKIYFGSDDNTVYALNPNSRLAGLPFNPPNNGEWEFATLSDVESKLLISESLSTVYVESESFFLYAINIVDGSPRWALDIDRFGGVADDDNLESSPTIGADGTIYVGSKDGHLYAVNHNDRLADPFPPVSNFPTVNEWISFDTGGAVRSSPAIDSDRIIYIGSDVGRLFAVNPDNGSEKWQFPDAMAAAIGEVRSSPTIGDNGIIYFGSNDTNVYAINPFINPRNRRDLYLTANEIDATVMDPNDWLNDGPWAVRLEVERSLVQNANGNYDYNLQLWMRQCTQADCSDILGTFFHDTRIKYDYSALEDLPLSQNIELSLTDHNLFNRFLFGFTTSTAAGESQSATIGEFNLSFIRPNDPLVTNDLNWPPP